MTQMRSTHLRPSSPATALLASAALGACIALAGCSSPDQTPAGHSSADRSDGHTASSSGLPGVDAARGDKLAHAKGKATGQACVDCHGANGDKPLDPTYPMIGGQYHDYIAHALQAYRDGQRGGTPTTDLMASQAKDLTDQQIADVATYFSTRPGTLHDLSGLK